MSKLIITRDDIRRAVEQYYKDYEPELFKKFNFNLMYFKIGDIEYVVEEKSDE